MIRLKLLGRPGCHLCDDARAMLERMAVDLPLEIEELDITEDDDLHRRYLERIPVITLDDEVLAELLVDETRLRERLARVSSR